MIISGLLVSHLGMYARELFQTKRFNSHCVVILFILFYSFTILAVMFTFDFPLQESKINIGPRSIICILEKAESKWWDKLLRGAAKTPHYVKVDWDKWVDEDDDTGWLFLIVQFLILYLHYCDF